MGPIKKMARNHNIEMNTLILLLTTINFRGIETYVLYDILPRYFLETT